MEEPRVFEHEQFGKIRMIEIEGVPWFVGKDIALALGYSNTKKAISDHVDPEDKRDGVTIRDPIGREQKPVLINESGLYSLIIGSKLESAHQFKRWVTSEVLPSIRKHGAYLTPEKIEEVLLNPDTIIKLATQLKEEHEKRVLLTKENAALTLQRLEWDKKDFVNAAVRRFAKTMPSYYPDVRFKQAWCRFKQELLYKDSINLEMRLTNMKKAAKYPSKLRLIDAIDGDVADIAVATITSMCREADVNIDDLLQNIPA